MNVNRLRRPMRLIVAGLAVAALPATFFTSVTSAAFTDSEYGTIALTAARQPPVISAVTTGTDGHAKVTSAFVGQLGATGQPSVDAWLRSLTTANDSVQGDITASETYTSSPNLTGAAMGTAMGSYTITYNVSNNQDVAATPVSVPVSIWGFVKIATANEQQTAAHTLALGSNGSVYGWGYNPYGQANPSKVGTNVLMPTLLSMPSGFSSPAVDVATSQGTSYVLDAAGVLWSWGYNPDGEAGQGTTASPAGIGQVKIPVPVQIRPNAAIGAAPSYGTIAASTYTASAVGTDGHVYSWGSANGYFANGNILGSSMSTPTAVTGIPASATWVAQGGWGGGAIAAGGQVFVWGTAAEGERANGTTIGTTGIATLVMTSLLTSLGNVTQLSYSARHLIALDTSGAVWGWGYNSTYQLGSKSSAGASLGTGDVLYATQLGGWPSGVSSLNAGYDYSLAVTSPGALYSVGYESDNSLMNGVNSGGVVTTPTLVVASGVAQASGSYDVSTYLSTDGSTVYGAGYGGDGELGNGTTSSSYTQNTPWTFTPPSLN
ncbi:RCC1 domain-containing protein [Gryllotalpicola reticulitermitis]|uniref:RCC1 domain-containing protein n=1 Tax=Gryllotalpicola reticulitermitis TaxID=1184153 RepID=A0ABV8Q9M1_9MICO